ncbi:chemerin-like receptor 1 [Spea bombifrons]|uniref:chemerin-like receptor 1 n=1 Tax=Spea bombifrons TaxID=233779 RepID=UPI00234B86B4|nr:chemerin-like receptor 1 [Spea bombifrons]
MENITSVSPTGTYSYYDYEDGDRGIHGLNVFTLCIYTVAFLLGTAGNGLVIWIAGFRMKKTVNVVWFLNLAIADFIFTFFLPLSIVYAAMGFHWPFGTFMCKLNSAVAFLNLFASIFILTVISLDRWISVVFPVWAQNNRTPRLAYVVILIVWVLAVCFSLTYFIFRDTDQFEDGTIGCYNKFHDEYNDLFLLRHRATVITRFIVGFFIPFTVIIACYSVIASRLYRNRMTTSTKPYKVILAVLISFFFCWFPYHVFSFLELYAVTHSVTYFDRVLQVGVPLASSLAFLNSCVNPFLYVFIGRDFKEKMRTSIQSIFEKAFSEDSMQTDLKSKTKSSSESHVV